MQCDVMGNGSCILQITPSYSNQIMSQARYPDSGLILGRGTTTGSIRSSPPVSTPALHSTQVHHRHRLSTQGTNPGVGPAA
jgi:hypothetical protein